MFSKPSFIGAILKMQRSLPAILAGCFTMICSQANAGFKETEWGMTTGEVQSVVPSAVENQDRTLDRQGLRAELIAPYEIATINFDAAFLFADDGSLQAVGLSKSGDHCFVVDGVLNFQFGPPKSNVTLVPNKARITTWDDTTSGNNLTFAFVAPGDGAATTCSLTYQPLSASGRSNRF